MLLDRRLLAAAYVVYLVAVLYLTLWPQAGTPSLAVTNLAELLNRAGFGGVTVVHVEVALNVVLFVPLGGIGVLLWPRAPWWSWALTGLAFSVALEAFQLAFLPGRTPAVSDLIANAAGAVAGAAAVEAVRRDARRPQGGPPVMPRPTLVAVAVALLAGAAVLVWTPTSELAASAVVAASELTASGGAPEWLVSLVLWERLLNVLLFVPFGVVLALARPRWSLLRWAAVGLLGSLVIELVQAAVLPGRDATVSDLATNTAGMVLGACLVKAALRSSRRET